MNTPVVDSEEEAAKRARLLTSRIAFGAFANWVNKATSVFLNLVLLPILFHHLSKTELGIWLLLGQGWASLGILDFGFTPTFTRRIAFAVGSGSTDSLGDLYATGRAVYRVLALLSLLVAFSTGAGAVARLDPHGLSFASIWLAWGLLCLTQGMAVWASVWTCLLQGVGYVGWEAIVSSVVGIGIICTQMLVVHMGAGLVGLASVAAGGAFVQRLVLLALARAKRPDIFGLSGVYDHAIFKQMLSLSLKSWITTLGIFVAVQTDQFFIAALFGAERIPAYRAAAIVLFNINNLAVTFALSSPVFIAQLWRAGEIASVHRIVKRNLRIGLSIVAFTGACLLALGNRFFDMWLGSGNYVGDTILACLILTFLLDTHSFILSTASRATEDEVFWTWACAAAALKTVFAILLGARFGLLGIALSTLLSQLATNYWYMSYRAFRRLGIGIHTHIRETVIPIAIWAAIIFISSLILSRYFSRDVLAVGSSIFASAVLLLAYLWSQVFNVDRGLLKSLSQSWRH